MTISAVKFSFNFSLVFERFDDCFSLQWFNFDDIHFKGEFIDEHPAIHIDSIVEDVKICQDIPEEVMKINRMKVYCKTAIKFGDSISKEFAIELIKSLGNCQLPNHCAHGRTVVAPFIDIDHPYLNFK